MQVTESETQTETGTQAQSTNCRAQSVGVWALSHLINKLYQVFLYSSDSLCYDSVL
jgi:hypothetical protein